MLFKHDNHDNNVKLYFYSGIIVLTEICPFRPHRCIYKNTTNDSSNRYRQDNNLDLIKVLLCVGSVMRPVPGETDKKHHTTATVQL